MHELSIAISIVEIAQEESERLGARVSAVHPSGQLTLLRPNHRAELRATAR